MPDVRIRVLEPADAVAFRDLRLRCFRDHAQAFTSSFEEESRKPLAASQARLTPGSREKFWGAFSLGAAGEMAGMVGLDRDPRRHCQHKGTVIAMYVAPQWTGRGVARALLDALLQEAREVGLERLVLTVTHGNQPAERLYQRMGFESFGIEPGAIKVGQRLYDKNHMALLL